MVVLKLMQFYHQKINIIKLQLQSLHKSRGKYGKTRERFTDNYL
jgi:hypothetical protein